MLMVLESVLVSFFYKWLTSFPSNTCERDFFLRCIFLPPLSKIRCPYVRGFISGLSILFHWSIFLSLCSTILSWWLWLCSRAWSQVGWFLQFHSSFSRLLWLFQVFFLYFHTNCEIICSSSVKNTVGSLIGITLNL